MKHFQKRTNMLFHVQILSRKYHNCRQSTSIMREVKRFQGIPSKNTKIATSEDPPSLHVWVPRHNREGPKCGLVTSAIAKFSVWHYLVKRLNEGSLLR